MTGLEKCCITSAYLQWLCHSGERPVAHGPLVSTQYPANWEQIDGAGLRGSVGCAVRLETWRPVVSFWRKNVHNTG